LLPEDADRVGHTVDEHLLVRERLARDVGIVVEPGVHGLQRVGQPADQLLELRLLLLDHADLGEQLRMLLVGGARQRGNPERHQGQGHRHETSGRSHSILTTANEPSRYGTRVDPGYLDVTTKWARRFLAQAASSWPGSKGNSLP